MKIDETHKFGNHVSVKTNIDLDEHLVERARQLTGLKTKKEVGNHALSELVRKRDQMRVLDLRGKISWVGDLDTMRQNRS